MLSYKISSFAVDSLSAYIINIRALILYTFCGSNVRTYIYYKELSIQKLLGIVWTYVKIFNLPFILSQFTLVTKNVMIKNRKILYAAFLLCEVQMHNENKEDLFSLQLLHLNKYVHSLPKF